MFAPELVASDLDGTLLTSDHQVSPRSLRAIARLRAAGIPFVAVTGRPRRWLPPVLAQTGPIGPVVCGNGALVVDAENETVLAEWLIPAAVLAGVTEALRAAIPGLVFAVERGPRMLHEPEYPVRWDLAMTEEVAVATTEITAGDASKLLVRAPGEDDPEALYHEVARIVGDAVTVTHAGFAGLVEIAAAGVTKATGLAWIAEHYGVGPAKVVAFGDMPNDAPMLRWAGRGVVVADAHPEAAAAADAVTRGNDADGVAVYLEALLNEMSAA
jgi:Cof subfamily protein (haloacid dehalogenase superfamily)